MQAMIGADRIRKLRWLCRRGMKELDILLERFVNAQAQALETGDWPALESLLATEDDVLWDLLQDPATSDDAAFRVLLHAIRDTDARAH